MKKLALIFGILLGSNLFAAADSDSIKDIRTAVKSLETGASFSFYDLHLSDQELKDLQSLQIKTADQYDNFGKIDAFPQELRAFLKKVGPNEEGAIEKASKIIERMVSQLVVASGQEAAHICMRATVPSPAFDTLRWHVDGYYYEPRTHQYKFVVSLKGPPTLFYKPSLSTREKFLTLLNEDISYQMDAKKRQILADLLNDPSQRFQAESTQGSAFVVGDEAVAAVHSEPPMPVERLFISVIPGTKEQIAEWQRR